MRNRNERSGKKNRGEGRRMERGEKSEECARNRNERSWKKKRGEGKGKERREEWGEERNV